MKKIKLAITGSLGRMGQQIIKSSSKNKNFKIVTLTENKVIKKIRSTVIGRHKPYVKLHKKKFYLA